MIDTACLNIPKVFVILHQIQPDGYIMAVSLLRTP